MKPTIIILCFALLGCSNQEKASPSLYELIKEEVSSLKSDTSFHSFSHTDASPPHYDTVYTWNMMEKIIYTDSSFINKSYSVSIKWDIEPGDSAVRINGDTHTTEFVLDTSYRWMGGTKKGNNSLVLDTFKVFKLSNNKDALVIKLLYYGHDDERVYFISPTYGQVLALFYRWHSFNYRISSESQERQKYINELKNMILSDSAFSNYFISEAPKRF